MAVLRNKIAAVHIELVATREVWRAWPIGKKDEVEKQGSAVLSASLRLIALETSVAESLEGLRSSLAGDLAHAKAANDTERGQLAMNLAENRVTALIGWYSEESTPIATTVDEALRILRASQRGG